MNDIKEYLTSANQEALPVIDSLYKYAITAETKSGIRGYAVRTAYWTLVFKDEHKGNMSWHANNLLWLLASHLHFNDKEIFGLWLSCSIVGCGKGLPSASEIYYGKKLSKLTHREMVGLVAMAKSPSVFKPGSDRSEKRIEFILKNGTDS